MSARHAPQNRHLAAAQTPARTAFSPSACTFTTTDNTANLIGSMQKVLDNFGGEGAR